MLLFQLQRTRLCMCPAIDWCTIRQYKCFKCLSTIKHPVNLSCLNLDKQWICKTCHNALKRGVLPARAKANDLYLDNIPVELNPLEVRLISLWIPFMKMVALPCGKRRAIHGPAVNVPTDLTPVCTLLPRFPSQTQMVPMKLKRKLCYKGHYMY